MYGNRGASGRFQKANFGQSAERMQGVSRSVADGDVSNTYLGSQVMDRRSEEERFESKGTKDFKKKEKENKTEVFAADTNPQIKRDVGVDVYQPFEALSDNHEEWDHSDEDEESESSQAKNREGETTPQTSFKEHEHAEETSNAPSQPKVSYSQVTSTPPRSPYSDTSSVTTRPLKILTYNNGKVAYVQREDVLAFENIYESKEVMQGALEATRLDLSRLDMSLTLICSPLPSAIEPRMSSERTGSR